MVFDINNIWYNRSTKGCAWGLSHSATQDEPLACLHGMQYAISCSVDSVLILIYSCIIVLSLQMQHTQEIHQQWTISFTCCAIDKVDCDQVQQTHDCAGNAFGEQVLKKF